jgi:hypothetical protein
MKYLATIGVHLRRFAENIGDKSLSDIYTKEVEFILTGIAGENRV